MSRAVASELERRTACEPLYDLDPQTGASVEVFYADQVLAASFGTRPVTSERGVPFSTAGFARMVERAGKQARLAFKAHPHMLRHACGYALANKGHDTRALQAYLGHRNIQHTVRYTELSPMRFKDFWRD
jgi:site-specific recombinase XerD